jgi:hypothetical protein
MEMAKSNVKEIRDLYRKETVLTTKNSKSIDDSTR